VSRKKKKKIIPEGPSVEALKGGGEKGKMATDPPKGEFGVEKNFGKKRKRNARCKKERGKDTRGRRREVH